MFLDNYGLIQMEQNAIPGAIGDSLAESQINIDNNRVIYCLEFPNGKKYIGQTKNINKRIINYKYNDTRNQHKIHNALKKYGFECVIFTIIAENLNLQQANELEIHYIKEFKCIENGYNISAGGNKSPTEQEEVKQKLRNYNALPEVKERKRNEMKKRMDNPIYRDKAIKTIHSKESRIKARKSMKDNNASCKTIQCIETKQIFISARDAAKFYNGSYKHLSSHLNKVITKKGYIERKHFKGLHFIFVKDNNDIG